MTVMAIKGSINKVQIQYNCHMRFLLKADNEIYGGGGR